MRNPWARIYSCWYDKVATDKKFADITILSRYKGLYPNMEFEAFVEWLMSPEGSDSCADRHWLSQHKLLAVKDEILDYDFIGKIENFDEHFLYIIEKVGFEHKKVKAFNRFSSSQDDYKKAYNERTIKLVAMRYRKDIELFNYEF